MTPREIVETLGLSPHPERGWYREMWRAEAQDGARAAGTAIYYLLEAKSSVLMAMMVTTSGVRKVIMAFTPVSIETI